jgi:predicted lipoprotein with Yx(FWY)xxD motif
MLLFGLALASILVLASVAFAQTTSTVELANNTTLGSILTNSQGMTLYILTADSAGNSTCMGACATAWPPLTVNSGETPTAGSGVTAQLGTITRADGTLQVTANGMPLYTFVRDTNAGDVNGQGKQAFGGTWYVVNAAGAMVQTAMPAAASTATATATPATGTTGAATAGAPGTLPTTGGGFPGALAVAALVGLVLIGFGGALELRTRRAR